MQEESVVAAIRQLRVDGQRITYRAINAITGGSYRDIKRLLHEVLTDVELGAMEADIPEPSPPPSQLTIAKEAVDAAEVAVGEVQNLLDTTQERLRTLQRERPPSTTDPHAVTDAVAAQLNHEADELKPRHNFVYASGEFSRLTGVV
jgi:hypothetical protein